MFSENNPEITQATMPKLSLLAWPVWLRMAVLVPVITVLWIAVAWAQIEILQ